MIHEGFLPESLVLIEKQGSEFEGRVARLTRSLSTKGDSVHKFSSGFVSVDIMRANVSAYFMFL